jgi:hypothetical protein
VTTPQLLQTTAGAGGLAGACAATPAVMTDAKSVAEISDTRFIESLLRIAPSNYSKMAGTGP